MAFDISELQGLLAQFQPSEEEKRKANMQALAQFGFGLMGARKGEEWDRAGRAGAYALQSRGDALHNATQSKMQGMQAAGQAMGLQEQMRKMADDDLLRQQTMEAAQKFGPGAQAATGSPAQPAVPGQAAAAPQGPSRREIAEQYRQRGDYWQALGRDAKAKQYYDAADKAMPKAKESKTMTTPDGKRVTVQFYEDGTHEIMQGVGPDAEKAHFLDTGSTIGAVDPFTGKPIAGGGMYNKTMTPDGTAADARAKATLAQSERHFQAGQAKENKPQWDSSSGQFVYPPSANAPTGRAISPEGFTKPDKPLSESQAKAAAFVNQMEDASSTLARLDKDGFNGKTAFQQGQIVNAGGTGIPFVPGTGMAQRAMSGEKAQKFQQAELQWTEGALRFMTGANAPEQEVIRNAATYFPRPGDSEAVIAQKALARKNMEQSVRMAAGAGEKKIPQRNNDGLSSDEAAELERLRGKYGKR